ncbi:hypothetical protein AAMO2058_000924600 [Amorphochlora amoebiformis]
MSVGLKDGAYDTSFSEMNRSQLNMTSKTRPFKHIGTKGLIFGDIEGESECAGSNKKCIALVTLVGSPSNTTQKDSCNVSSSSGSLSTSCIRWFTAFAHVLHAKRRLINAHSDPKYRNYSIDLVLLHDNSLSTDQLSLARSFGVRTLDIPTSIMRSACTGYVKSNPESSFSEKDCLGKPMTLKWFPENALNMFLRQTTPSTLGLTNYDVVAFADPKDMLMSVQHLIKGIEYILNMPASVVLANAGEDMPMDFGVWITRPHSEHVSNYINAIRTGFSTLDGRNNSGSISECFKKRVSFTEQSGKKWSSEGPFLSLIGMGNMSLHLINPTNRLLKCPGLFRAKGLENLGFDRSLSQLNDLSESFSSKDKMKIYIVTKAILGTLGFFLMQTKDETVAQELRNMVSFFKSIQSDKCPKKTISMMSLPL